MGGSIPRYGFTGAMRYPFKNKTHLSYNYLEVRTMPNKIPMLLLLWLAFWLLGCPQP